MPSLKEITGVITMFVVIAFASGHREWVWKPLIAFRAHVLKDIQKPWGCPSIFDKDACTTWKRAR